MSIPSISGRSAVVPSSLPVLPAAAPAPASASSLEDSLWSQEAGTGSVGSVGITGESEAVAPQDPTAVGETTDIALPKSSVRTSLPIEQLTKIGASESGEAFHLDSSKVARMEVRARQIVTPTGQKGTELSLRLAPGASRDLSARIAAGELPTTLTPYSVEKASFKDGAQHLEAEGAYLPRAITEATTNAHRVEESGKYTVDFIPQKGMSQAYRDRMRIRVFGDSDVERQNNLEAALQKMGLRALIADADPLQSQRFVRLSLLRMVAPGKVEALASRLSELSLSELDAALAEAGVDAERVKNARVEEVFPGHMAVVDPSLGEAYVNLGARAMMVGVKELDTVARVLTSDGLMSTTERYNRGLHRPGASSATDEQSGGAEYAFTRLVTDDVMKGSNDISRSMFSGVAQLLSLGDPLKKLLSRTDWHAYAKDTYGATVAASQVEGTDGDAALSSLLSRYGKYGERPSLKQLLDAIEAGSGGFASSNEACFGQGVSSGAFTHVAVKDETARQELLGKLKEAGVTALHGAPIEERVIVAKTWNDVAKQANVDLG